MRQPALTPDLRAGTVDWHSMSGWKRLALMGLMVSLPVPMIAATGLAVPLPSMVYRVALGVAEQTQAIAVGLPGFEAVVEETTQVARRGAIRLSAEEVALAGGPASVPEPRLTSEPTDRGAQETGGGLRTERAARDSAQVESAEPEASVDETQETTPATTGSETPGAVSRAPTLGDTERPSPALGQSPDRSGDAPSSPAAERPSGPATDTPARVLEPKPTPPKQEPRGGPNPAPPPPLPPPLSLLPVVGPPIDSPPELLPQTAEEKLEQVAADLEAIARENVGTPLASTVGDALAKMQSALAKLRQSPPDQQAGVGDVEGAVGDLEAGVEDGLLGFVEGTDLMNRSADAARLFAARGIDEARTRGGAVDKITQAEKDLAKGDADRALGAFKDAVGKYRDALAAAEGA